MSEAEGIARLLTWNIRGGIGADRRYDLDRVVALVRRHDPDIIAIQEIDSRRSEPGRPAFAVLKEALGAHAIEAKAITAPDGDYGHALITRWPVVGTQLHDVSLTGREPRWAIETSVVTPYGPLHLVSVHLGLSFGERRHQAELLAGIAARGGQIGVLLGDFNDWLWRGAVRRAIGPGAARTRVRTFPAICPVLMLDRVYCRPPAALRRAWTDWSARPISDHLPLIAEVAVARSAEAVPPAGDRENIVEAV